MSSTVTPISAEEQKRHNERALEKEKRGKGVPGVAALSGIVIVNVGPEPFKFQVHANLLAYHSEYFRKALNGPWKEATERIITLADVEPGTFILLVNWLYTQRLPKFFDDWQDMEIFGTDYLSADARLRELIKAYALGDRLLAPAFRRATLRSFNNTFRYYVSSTSNGGSLVPLAFEILPQNCVLLQNLIDTYCSRWCKNEEVYGLETQKDFPPDFLRRSMHKLHEIHDTVLVDVLGPRRIYCYMEHSSKIVKDACQALHFRWDPEKELGFFE